MSSVINIERINGRLPTLCFGLSWQPLQLDPAVAAQRKGLQAERIRGLREQAEAANILLRDASDFADLDALVFYFDGKEPKGHISGIIDHVLDGALAHTGDDRTGAGGGWDELVMINLEIMPPSVTTLALIIDSAAGHPFDQVPGVRASLITAHSQTVLASLSQPFKPGSTTCLMGLLRRTDEGFAFHQTNEFMNAQSLGALEQWWKDYL